MINTNEFNIANQVRHLHFFKNFPLLSLFLKRNLLTLHQFQQPMPIYSTVNFQQALKERHSRMLKINSHQIQLLPVLVKN